MKANIKAHKHVMELEDIIEKMGDAMRKAYLPYLAESGKSLTPRMEWELYRFKQFAIKVNEEHK